MVTSSVRDQREKRDDGVRTKEIKVQSRSIWRTFSVDEQLVVDRPARQVPDFALVQAEIFGQGDSNLLSPQSGGRFVYSYSSHVVDLAVNDAPVALLGGWAMVGVTVGPGEVNHLVGGFLWNRALVSLIELAVT